MDFLSIAQHRYTTKKYNKDKKISEDNIQSLKEILRLCPSSINSQPWRFTFVNDEKIKQQLAQVSMINQEKILNCSHLVVFSVIDHIETFEKQIETHLPEGAVNYYKHFVKTKPEAEVKSWLKNQVYISLGFFLSACATMQIDSTAMEGIEPEEYNKILGTDTAYKTVFAVAIGYRDSADANQPNVKAKQRLPLHSVVIE